MTKGHTSYLILGSTQRNRREARTRHHRTQVSILQSSLVIGGRGSIIAGKRKGAARRLKRNRGKKRG